MFFEINLRKRKWLLGCSSNPDKSKIQNQLNKTKLSLELFSSKYENFLKMSMSDFNSEPIEKTISGFMEIYDIKNLVDMVSISCKNSDVLLITNSSFLVK